MAATPEDGHLRPDFRKRFDKSRLDGRCIERELATLPEDFRPHFSI
jgi:hypothetical protein